MAPRSTTWSDLPSDIRASIISKVAGSEPLKTGNLRHMAVSREWRSATCQAVRSLHLPYSDYERSRDLEVPLQLRLAAASTCGSPLSCFPNLESLTFESNYVGPIRRSAAASCPKLRVLHLRSCGRTVSEADLRAVLQGCVQLRELHCDIHQLEFCVPQEIGNLTALTSLKLSCNYETHSYILPDAITRLGSLQEVHLENLKHAIHPSFFSADSPLRSFTLWQSEVEGLPDSFTTLQRLESLNLHLYSFTRLPDLSTLSSLTCLDLKECENIDVRPLFSDLPWLQVLRVGGAQQHDVPAEIGRYASLEVLRIVGFENIACLPAPLGQLRSLSELTLEDCTLLSSLPESFGQLQSLQKVVLGLLPELRTLPETVGQLTQLKTLDISRCGKLLSLPVALSSRCSLQSLKLQALNLVYLPESFGLLSSLRYLELVRCMQLAILPDSFGQLSSLCNLRIAGCKELRVRPDVFGSLSSLCSLSVDVPRLTDLPSDLGNLRELRSLFISSSILKAIPDSLGQLTNLTSLSLYDCHQLRSLPDSFTQLVGLKNLCLSGCSRLEKLPLVDGELPGVCSSVGVYECPQLELPDRYRESCDRQCWAGALNFEVAHFAG